MNQPAEVWIRQPRDIPAHIKYAHRNGRGLLMFEQIEELVKAINPAYVSAKQGKSYLAQHQARAEMNRIFGYGNWDVIEEDPTLLYEEERQNNGTKYIACYRGRVTVNIRDLWGMPVCTVTGTHAEANANLPDRSEAHAMAITSVLSYALRRALINLGDRFGLGLYNGGSTAPHGQYTIQLDDGVMFDWVQPGQNAPQPQQGVAAPQQQVSHETIQAQPVISDDGADPNWVDPTQQPAQQPVQQQGGYVPQQGPTPQGDGTVADMQGIAQQQAEARQNYVPPQQQMQQQQGGYDPSVLARLQGGFKQDGQG